MQMAYPSLEKTRVATIAGMNIYALDRDHYGKRAGSLYIMRRAADGSLTNVYFKHWPAELKAAYHYHRGLHGGGLQGGMTLREKFDAYWKVYLKYQRKLLRLQDDVSYVHHRDMFVRYANREAVYQILLRYHSMGYTNEPAYKPILTASYGHLFINGHYYPDDLYNGFLSEINELRVKFGDP